MKYIKISSFFPILIIAAGYFGCLYLIELVKLIIIMIVIRKEGNFNKIRCRCLLQTNVLTKNNTGIEKGHNYMKLDLKMACN